MRRLPLFLVLICLYATKLIGQDIYPPQQALADMLSRNEFFEARKQRKLCGDTLDKSLELCYAFKMHGYLNRPDSSAIYLERLLKEYPDFFGDRYSKVYFMNELLNLYAEMGKYSKKLEVYNIAEQIISPYLLTNDSIWATQQLIAISRLRREDEEKLDIPQMTVTNLSKKKETTLTFTEEPILASVIEYNGVSVKTWIDTGWGNTVFMTKAIADKCKVKELPSLEDNICVNGVSVRGYQALIDSLKIGAIQFAHVPAIVVHGDFSSFAPDSVLSETSQLEYDSVMNSAGVVVGLPLLKRLGSIQLDWHKKKITMKLPCDVRYSMEEPTMFMLNKGLYTCVNINAVDCTGLIDTGAPRDCIELTKKYYDANRVNLLVNGIQKEKSKDRRGMAQVASSLKYRPILNPKVTFNSKKVKLKIDDVIAWQEDTALSGIKDGLIGCQFLKRLGSKVKLDFVNMQIMAE